MDQPLTIYNQNLATDQSMGATFTTPASRLEEINGYAIQVTWAGGGTPVGVLSLQCSNTDTDATYVEITGTSTSISGNTGAAMFNVSAPGYQFVRVVYTRTSGTAVAQVKISGKRT